MINNFTKDSLIKVNFGCFNTNIDGWIGIDLALRHIIICKIPFLSYLLWKTGVLNNEQYQWHKNGLFRTVRYGDATKKLRFKSCSVDYIYCEGVLHHTSNPFEILKEFYRVLRKNSNACVMVYNRNSIWFHLYTAYDKMILQNAFNNMDVDEAFSRNTDGVKCPIARNYTAEDFSSICKNVGFEVEYKISNTISS